VRKHPIGDPSASAIGYALLSPDLYSSVEQMGHRHGLRLLDNAPDLGSFSARLDDQLDALVGVGLGWVGVGLNFRAADRRLIRSNGRRIGPSCRRLAVSTRPAVRFTRVR
jgi:hypothetical protein